MKALAVFILIAFSYPVFASEYSAYHKGLVEDSCKESPNHDESSFKGFTNEVCECVSDKFIQFLNQKENMMDKAEMLQYGLIYYQNKYDPSLFDASTKIYEDAFVSLEVKCFKKLSAEDKLDHEETHQLEGPEQTAPEALVPDQPKAEADHN